MTQSAPQLVPAVIRATRAAPGGCRAMRLSALYSGARAAIAARYRTPGQYIMVGPADGSGRSSPFALANQPGDGDELEILVKPPGEVAEHLVALPVGASAALSEPLGDGFALERALGCDVLALAAGTAIAPVRAAIDWMCARRPDFARIHLCYGQAVHSDFVYTDWLASLANRGASFELVASREGGGYVQQRIDSDRYFARPENTAVVVCGKDEMVADVRALCQRRGIAEEKVLTNY